MSEMTPETEAKYREAQERLERAKRERSYEVSPIQPTANEWDLRLAAMLRDMPEPTPEELAAEEARRREEDAKAERVAAKRRRDAVARAIGEMPIKRELVDAIADDRIGTTSALTTVQRWLESPGAKPVLMLLGGVGSGKTVAAAWAVASYARRSMGAKYDKMRDVANLYRAGFGDDLKAFERMLRVPLLVIDELTTERDADLGKAALHEVVDERASRDLRTLLLANRTKDEIRERYDARTIDRLRECAAVVTLADKSMRKGAW